MTDIDFRNGSGICELKTKKNYLKFNFEYIKTPKMKHFKRSSCIYTKI